MSDGANLAELQGRLQRTILSGEVRDDADATRVGVYVTAYRLRLIEALAANFPRLQQLCGNEQFAQLATRYLERCPSESISVRWFGHRLSEFLRDDAALAAMPWLHELAQWEWEIAAAFDAPDGPSIELSALNVLPEQWPSLQFSLHPSVRMLRLTTNAVVLFNAMSADDAHPPAPAMLDSPQRYVIWRSNYDIRFREQSDDEGSTLQALAQNETFEALCVKLCDWWDENEVPARAASLLRTWVTEGFITRLEYSS